MIRLAHPDIREEDISRVSLVLRDGMLVQGERVKALEDSFAKYIGAEHAVALNSGTSALYLALHALDIRTGDQILVPAYCWPAISNVVILLNADPVFIDIDPTTFNMDPAHLKAVLPTLSRPKAILVAHLFGAMANMPNILSIASQWDIPVIEDAACALGSSLNGRRAGAWGTMACFSFHPRKIITTGEGGMVTTNNPRLAETIRALRNHGLDPQSDRREFLTCGFNLRLTEFQAVLGISQLGRIEDAILVRRKIADRYHELLSSGLVIAPRALSNSIHVYQSYVVLLPETLASERDAVIEELLKKGIETTFGTIHIPLSTFVRTRYGYKPGRFPQTDSVSDRSLALPFSLRLDSEDQRFVVHSLMECLSKRLSR